jgi:hypothetical protein
MMIGVTHARTQIIQNVFNMSGMPTVIDITPSVANNTITDIADSVNKTVLNTDGTVIVIADNVTQIWNSFVNNTLMYGGNQYVSFVCARCVCDRGRVRAHRTAGCLATLQQAGYVLHPLNLTYSAQYGRAVSACALCGCVDLHTRAQVDLSQSVVFSCNGTEYARACFTCVWSRGHFCARQEWRRLRDSRTRRGVHQQRAAAPRDHLPDLRVADKRCCAHLSRHIDGGAYTPLCMCCVTLAQDAAQVVPSLAASCDARQSPSYAASAFWPRKIVLMLDTLNPLLCSGGGCVRVRAACVCV